MKIRFLLILTTVVDVFWLLFWIPYYNDKEIAKFNYGLHMFVVFVSILEIALKVIIFFALFKAQGNMLQNQYNQSMGGANKGGY